MPKNMRPWTPFATCLLSPPSVWNRRAVSRWRCLRPLCRPSTCVDAITVLSEVGEARSHDDEDEDDDAAPEDDLYGVVTAGVVTAGVVGVSFCVRDVHFVVLVLLKRG